MPNVVEDEIFISCVLKGKLKAKFEAELKLDGKNGTGLGISGIMRNALNKYFEK